MQRLDTLTTFDLEMAAGDLRNAGLVVQHAGHAKSKLIDSRTGAVCAGGAIDLATFRQLGYAADVKHYVVIDDLGGRYRAENAYLVFADFLPADLCPGCEYTAPCPAHGLTCQARDDETSPWERVVHYNDFHCTGGDLLTNMLDLAASAAERIAANKRKMLTGAPLITT